MADKISKDNKISFDTRDGEPVMVQNYSGLNTEHKMPNGMPSAWAVSFAATRDGRFTYNRVIYVRQCNICPLSDGKMMERMPIYHAVVVFMMSDKLSHILLLKDDHMLVNLLQKYHPSRILYRNNVIVLRDYWRSVEVTEVFAMESPKQAKSPYQNYQCASLPGWFHGEEERESVVALSEYSQSDVYMAAGMTVLKDVDYVIDAPGIKITIHYAYVYADHERKTISLVQRDVCL